MIHLAGLKLPLTAVTETFALLACRGAGKTNAARCMAEAFFAAKLPFVAIDPVGSWWGLQFARDGKSTGLPIPVFGGRHGDLPLERESGELVADLVVDGRISCVLDTSEFESEAAKRYFLLKFAQRIYRRNTQPLHLFLEEADDYIPQRVGKEQAHLMHAVENLVRRGRARGLGMTMITQRSASLNKGVLTQTGTLIAMRTTGPQDRKAIELWVAENDERKDILASLPKLGNGEAWVWSPSFLQITERVQFPLSRTFDSGATPTGAKSSAPVKTKADLNLDEIRAKMAETIERVKADDPRELRKEIDRLNRELKQGFTMVERVEVPVFDREAWNAAWEAILGHIGGIERATQEGKSRISQVLGAWHDRCQATADAPAKPLPKQTLDIGGHSIPILRTAKDIQDHLDRHGIEPKLVGPRTPRPENPANGAKSGRPAGEIKVLTAIAQHPNGVTRPQLSILTGYKHSSRDAYVQRLRQDGLVETGERVTATAAGMRELGPNFRRLPTGRELQKFWLQWLPAGEAKILEVLIRAHPRPVAREVIGHAVQYKHSSRDAYIQRLERRELVERVTGGVKASDELF